jgi:hypothetical protein
VERGSRGDGAGAHHLLGGVSGAGDWFALHNNAQKDNYDYDGNLVWLFYVRFLVWFLLRVDDFCGAALRASPQAHECRKDK